MHKAVARRIVFALSLGLARLALAGDPAAVQAFEIKPQPLADALRAFAEQTGEQVMFFSELGKGRESAPVSGRYTPEQALRKLLENTGLTYQWINATTVAITDARRGAASPTRSSVRLAQAAESSEVAKDSGIPRVEPARAASASSPAAPIEEVVVTGTQIHGAKVADTLPITVVGRAEIAAIGAVSGNELFRAIPQLGDVNFQASRTTGNLNDARGDVSSINLRSLGTGNTLVLLNGRRTVLHPGVQTEFQVPVQTTNMNAVPVAAIDHVEILRDGAAAIYGTDAVAGVINEVLEKDLDGVRVEGQYGGAEASGYREQTYGIKAGHLFNGTTQVNLFAGFTRHTPLFAVERPFSASEDHRPLLNGALSATDATNFDVRSTSSPWAVFDMVSPRTVKQGAASLTNASGQFHIEPSTNTVGGCSSAVFANGTCLRSGLQSTTNDRVLRFDDDPDRTLDGDLKRANLFSTIDHEISDSLHLFGELSYYHADFEGEREQSALLSSARITIPASNYWNPFGPSTSPNRLPGLTGVPASGLDLILRTYRPVDAGVRTYDVTDSSYRTLAGLRGAAGGFEWESALLYSEARTEDVTHNAVSNTLFQQSLAKNTPDAYNPFNGGDPVNYSRGDATPNSQATSNAFLVDVTRFDKSSLALWDLKASRPDLLHIWGGSDVGLATGVEVRHETYLDERDDRLNGTTPFTDMVTHITYGSDIMGASAAPNVSANRTVGSAFLELAVPLVSPEMGVPLVQDVRLQLAGRDEHYSDFGNVAKPRAALSWKVVDSLMLRTAWSQSFRAPNLAQFYSSGTQVSNSIKDSAFCLANGISLNAATCAAASTTSIRSGNQSLKAEDADSFSVGLVFQPTFLPASLGRVSAAVDYWSIKETNVIGIIGDVNQLALDYLYRLHGSSNPNVVRNAPSAGQTLGDVQYITDNYLNLNARRVEGLDFSLGYSLNRTPLGSFDLRVNAAKLLKWQQEASGPLVQLIAAQASGELPPVVNVNGVGDLIGQDGTPRWKGSAGLSWKLRGWGAGVFANYVGSTYDSGFVLADGTRFTYSSWTTFNLYASHSFEPGPWFGDTDLAIGVRNLANKFPPLTSAVVGFNGAIASPLGRYWYASIGKRF